MAARCEVCRNPKCKEIEDLIFSDEISQREASRFYGLNRTQIQRHLKNHTSYQPKLAPKLVPEWEPPGTVTLLEAPVSTLDRVHDLTQSVEEVIEMAEARGNPDMVLSGVQELRAGYELAAKLSGEAKEAETAPIDRGRTVIAIRQFGIGGEKDFVRRGIMSTRENRGKLIWLDDENGNPYPLDANGMPLGDSASSLPWEEN